MISLESSALCFSLDIYVGNMRAFNAFLEFSISLPKLGQFGLNCGPNAQQPDLKRIL